MLAIRTTAFALICSILLATGCAKKESFNIRDVDPGQAGTVRSLGPESQDVVRLADLMVRSLLESHVISSSEHPPTIAMLPMENNTRFAFSQEIFTTKLKAELNKQANGRLRFVARDLMDDIQAERQAKRAGEVDYDPEQRTLTVAGADYFLAGRVDGLGNASRLGQSEYAVYAFKLVNSETGIEEWEDLFDVKKEGRDDVVYR